jgi:hypothetical protein
MKKQFETLKGEETHMASRSNITGALLKKVAKVLDASDFDLAGGLREDEINNFLTAHYNQQSPGGNPGGVYSGGGNLDDIGLNYTYAIDAAIVATVAPLSDAKFKSLMNGWVSTVPELAKFGPIPAHLPAEASGAITDPPPPNIQLNAPQMTLTITASDGSIDPPAVLKFSMTATGYVAATTSGGVVTVTVVPIAVRLDNPGRFQREVVAAMKQLGFRDKAKADPDCIPLQKLILHIVNAVIAPRLSGFVKEFTFPVPIRLFNNVVILGVALDVEDKLVVVLATVGFSTAAAPTLALPGSLTPREIEDTRDRLVSEAEAEFKRGPGHDKKKAKMKKLNAASTFPNKGIFLLLHQRFFQVLADALLVTSASHQDGGNFGPIFYSYGWSMKTWNPVATVSGNQLLLSVDCEGSAGATAGIHTHCGDISATVSASADALPANFTAMFFFDNQNRELWTSLAAQPFTVKWTIGGLPWPLSDAIEGLLDIFTDLGIAFISAFGLRWKQKLTTVPDTFPGTQLKYDLNLDQQVVADPSTGALMVAGSVNFKSS